MSRSLALALVLVALTGIHPAASEPLRLAGWALDRKAEIEVRDLPRQEAQQAIGVAFRELERARADLRAIESTAQPGVRVQLDENQAELLRRTLGVCEWSAGAVGPLGARVFRLWGLRIPATSFPVPDEIDAAVESARCDRARIDLATRILTVEEGSRLDFYPFELGWAVDRAAATLRAAGAANFWIEIGPITLAAGDGPGGRGWLFEPPLFGGQQQPLAPVELRDHAVATLRPGDRPLRVAGESFAPFVDLSRGRPGDGGTVAVLAASELAIDAQAVGYAMFVLGPRRGTMLLGSLQPRPSIRWLLGGGDAPPLLTDVNWSAVSHR